MRTSLRIDLPFIVLMLASRLAAADPDRGKLLYENHCDECHASTVHVREKHKAKSRDDVLSWIERWQTHLKLNWGAREMKDVLDYLDLTYYQFSKQ